MPEKRQHKRQRKRLNVKFGDKGLTGTGFTLDVSQGGMFLVTAQMLPLNSKVVVDITLEFAGRELELDATVVHVMPPDASSPGGLGVVFSDRNLDAALQGFLPK